MKQYTFKIVINSTNHMNCGENIYNNRRVNLRLVSINAFIIIIIITLLLLIQGVSNLLITFNGPQHAQVTFYLYGRTQM